MKRSRKPAPKALLKCARCGLPIAEKRAPFLVMVQLGEIIGPYHAGCAELVVIDHKRKLTGRSIPGLSYGRRVPESREETLPW